jgi:phosphoserine phosphatase
MTPGPAREPSHLVTVLGVEITAEVLSAVLHRLVSVSTAVFRTRTMATHPYTALEIAVRLSTPHPDAEAVLRPALSHTAQESGVDIALLRAGHRYDLVAFELAGTLGRGVSTDGDVRDRAAALAGWPTAALADLAAAVHPSPGALVAVRALQSHGVKVGAISDGFDQVLGTLARGLRLDFLVANTLETTDGVLTGRLTGTVLDGPAKAAALRRTAAAERIPLTACAAVGHRADDTDLITAAGLGIAFDAAAAAVAAADVSVSYPRLDLVLPLLGVPVPCAALD